MHHQQNSIYIEPHSEDAYLYEEREFRLINLKALRGELGFHSPRRGPSHFSLTGLLSTNSIRSHVR